VTHRPLARVLAVNNFSGHRGLRWISALKDSFGAAGATVNLIDSSEAAPVRFRECDGVVLSGSHAMLSRQTTVARFAREIEAVQNTSTPLLGICFGHQLLGIAFGSRVARAAAVTERYTDTEVLTHDALFDGLQRRISVYESHYEVVDSVPEGFKLIARSGTCAIAAIKHAKAPVYGIQFHPEKNSLLHPDGRLVVSNFVRVLS
jgi:GMP synthase (glutamine-hydrolysing)